MSSKSFETVKRSCSYLNLILKYSFIAFCSIKKCHSIQTSSHSANLPTILLSIIQTQHTAWGIQIFHWVILYQLSCRHCKTITVGIHCSSLFSAWSFPMRLPSTHTCLVACKIVLTHCHGSSSVPDSKYSHSATALRLQELYSWKCGGCNSRGFASKKAIIACIILLGQS